MKLHIGAGGRQKRGWKSVDVRRGTKPDYVMDAGALDFEDDSIESIYACHVLEHTKEPLHVLEEWNRVLRYHGTLWLAVPDMGQIAYAYIHGGVHLSRIAGLIWGRHDYAENIHHHGWDYETLAELLREARFFDVKRWHVDEFHLGGYHDFSFAEIHAESGSTYPMSLNVKAKKI